MRINQLFFYLLILTTFFFLFEISFFIQANQTYLSDFTEVSSHITIPMKVLPSIIYFLIAQVIVHLGYAILIAILTALLSYLFPLSKERFITLGITLWFLGMVTILFANRVYFPNSKFAELISIMMNAQVAYYLLWSLLAIISLVLFFAAMGLIKLGWLNRKTALVFLSILLILLVNRNEKPVVLQSRQAVPNIIIVGVDALRPDFLGRHSHTPFLNHFLNQATVFSDAFTPLARTFPSWTGILTGDYPKQTQARFNLPDQSHLNFKNSLAAILQKKGYETVYASDETRFSNIETKMGFNQIITPPIGLNDFLLGTFNDFPLSNLIINTDLGRYLFPHSYGNRPAFVTYDPTSFLTILKKPLSTIKEKPLFLAIHFCLPHWPYLWGALDGNANTILERYEKSIERVDQQLAGLFAILKSNGFLEQAIVVVLSDHGEAFELSGDRITKKELYVGEGKVPHFYPPSLDDEQVDQSAGHGTDVLGLPQYRTLLAFKLYGWGEQKVGVVSDLVTLLDIQPTVLDLLHLPNQKISLAKVIRGHASKKPFHDDVFLESDFTPSSMRTVYPEMNKVALEGINLFQINPETTRITVKPDMGQRIIQSKQFADIHGEWILALYPQHQAKPIPVLVNLRTGKWTTDLNSPFAKQANANRMLLLLKQFFGSDLVNVSISPN